MSPRRSSPLVRKNFKSKKPTNSAKLPILAGAHLPYMERQMQRPPISVILLSLCGGLIGLLMAMEGLQLRLLGAAIPPFGVPGLLGGPTQLVQLLSKNLAASLAPEIFGWPLIAVGTSWSGVIVSLWIRQRWGYYAAVVIGFLSLLYFGIGTFFAALSIFLLGMPQTRQWVKSKGGPSGS